MTAYLTDMKNLNIQLLDQARPKENLVLAIAEIPELYKLAPGSTPISGKFKMFSSENQGRCLAEISAKVRYVSLEEATVRSNLCQSWAFLRFLSEIFGQNNDFSKVDSKTPAIKKNDSLADNFTEK